MYDLTLLTSGTTGLNAQWITDFMGIVKEAIAICSEFPLNILLTASLVAAGVGVFSRLKNALT